MRRSAFSQYTPGSPLPPLLMAIGGLTMSGSGTAILPRFAIIEPFHWASSDDGTLRVLVPAEHGRSLASRLLSLGDVSSSLSTQTSPVHSVEVRLRPRKIFCPAVTCTVVTPTGGLSRMFKSLVVVCELRYRFAFVWMRPSRFITAPGEISRSLR